LKNACENERTGLGARHQAPWAAMVHVGTCSSGGGVREQQGSRAGALSGKASGRGWCTIFLQPTPSRVRPPGKTKQRTFLAPMQRTHMATSNALSVCARSACTQHIMASMHTHTHTHAHKLRHSFTTAAHTHAHAQAPLEAAITAARVNSRPQNCTVAAAVHCCTPASCVVASTLT
jgi:hypothetical protein